jgi:beta-carotene 3-hydroxylase
VNDHLEYVPDVVEKKRFEKNDRFFLVYAIPAIVLMMTGIALHKSALIFIACGITLYGFTYFIVHDVIIHKRLPIKFLHRNHSHFIRSVIKAHTAHHRPKSKDDFNNFGLLVFRFKYFKS